MGFKHTCSWHDRQRETHEEYANEKEEFECLQNIKKIPFLFQLLFPGTWKFWKTHGHNLNIHHILQSLRMTNLIAKFSTWFLGSFRKLFCKKILFRWPKISLTKVIFIWHSNRPYFFKMEVCLTLYLRDVFLSFV